MLLLTSLGLSSALATPVNVAVNLESFPQMILENLKTAGVQQAHKEDRITFTSLTPWPGEGSVCAEGRYMEGGHADGEAQEKRAGIFIGPEFGTVLRSDLVEAARECGDAGFDVLIGVGVAPIRRTLYCSIEGVRDESKARGVCAGISPADG